MQFTQFIQHISRSNRLIVLISLLLASIWLSIYLFTATLDKTQVYQVRSGVGFSQVSRELNSTALWILAKISPTKLHSGYYQIQANMYVFELLAMFDNGQIKVENITLIEGKNIADYFVQLSLILKHI
jgi:cell division protein YceG involved in septum cleavage